MLPFVAVGAGVTYAAGIKGVEGADQPVEPGVEGMVGRGRAGVVASAGECVDNLRLNVEGRVSGERAIGVGDRRLEMADGQIGPADHRRDAGEDTAEVVAGAVGSSRCRRTAYQRPVLVDQHITGRDDREGHCTPWEGCCTPWRRGARRADGDRGRPHDNDREWPGQQQRKYGDQRHDARRIRSAFSAQFRIVAPSGGRGGQLRIKQRQPAARPR